MIVSPVFLIQPEHNTVHSSLDHIARTEDTFSVSGTHATHYVGEILNRVSKMYDLPSKHKFTIFGVALNVDFR